MTAVIGIDIGTSGTKTLAMDEEGKVLADCTSEEYPVHRPKPLHSEQDPEDWWKATVSTVRSVMERSGLAPEEVAAIGLSGQMHGSVFLDSQNRVIRKALLWNDQRTEKEVKEIEKLAGGPKALIKMVANPAMTGFTAPKILWLRNNHPEQFKRMVKVLLPKDYIRLRLTGEFATEVSDASGTLLLDVARRRWSSELLAALDLKESLLARCYESHEVTGRLTAEAAKELGLSTRCKVVGGAGDCAAGAVGTGIVQKGRLSTSIGTSGVMFVHCDDVIIHDEGRVHTFCHAVAGKWHMMGVNLSAGGALQWFRNKLCRSLVAMCQSCEVEAYEVLGLEAAKAPRGSDGLFFLPHMSGERTPHRNANARGALVGLTESHHRGHVVRAIMEGVTYNLRDSLAIFRELGVPVEEVRASGGGGKSALWRQIQADVLGHEIRRLKVEQGPAYGVAILAAVGAGIQPDVPTACAKYVELADDKHLPDAAARAFYDRGFEIYKMLYPALETAFQKIAELG
ncbi:MAG: xylulokinase [Planctomycetia bacterium]|nr:xylulokinase [Planctomycetia bacterium]